MGRLILFAILLGLLAWIPMVAPQGFGGDPILAVVLLGMAALVTVFRHKREDD